MEHYAKKEIVEVSEVYDYTRCDGCGALISVNLRTKERSKVDLTRTRLVAKHTITMYHNDWGNDSIESHRTLHACDTCLPKFLQFYAAADRSEKHLEVESAEGRVPTYTLAAIPG